MSSGDRIKLRKTGEKGKRDRKKAAEFLERETTGIDPWNLDQVVQLLTAARATGTLNIHRDGNTPYVAESTLIDWFENQIQAKTVVLNWEHYRKSQGLSFYDILVSGLDATDLNSGRQRSFGQHLENAIGGYLAELAVAKFLEGQGLDKAFVELGSSTNLDDAKGSDIVAITRDDEPRAPNASIQVKKSKPKSIWLPLESKDEAEADVFVLGRVGLPYAHIAQYLREAGILDETLEEIDEEKRGEIAEQIPTFDSIPVHISGFARWEEFETGNLTLKENRVNSTVIGGIGRVPTEPPADHDTDKINVQKIGDLSEDYIASISALSNTDDDWDSLIEEL